MSDTYTLDVLNSRQTDYIVSIRRYCANTEGINAFMNQITNLDGARIVGDKTFYKIKTYLQELAERINEQYSDGLLDLTFHKGWHGDNCDGFDVYSVYCARPVCDVYFIRVSKTICLETND